MKKLLFLLAVPAVWLASSCSREGNAFGPDVRGTGPVQAETRPLNSFSRLELKIDAEVVLTPGSPQQVRVEAQRNILDVLETDVAGDKLAIGFGRYNVRSHEPIRVYVTLPALTELEVSGSGKVRTAGSFAARNFRVAVSGSGEAQADVAGVDALQTKVSGSGEVKLSGSAVRNDVSISGSGRVSAYGLTAQDTHVAITGSGNGYLRVARALDADIAGSGSVYYKGSPQVSSRITGSGRVLADN